MIEMAIALILNFSLQYDVELNIMAQTRAEQLCGKELSHKGWTRVFRGSRRAHIGENLARGYNTPQGALVALEASPAHLRNLQGFDRFGVGYACNTYVQLFSD